jgi:hypothetical protein
MTSLLAELEGILHHRYHRVKNCMTWCQSKMNYCNVVYGFINYTPSNSKNISECDIKCLCKRCKNKKFLDLDVVMMHLLQKRFMKRYMCWFAHGEPYIPHEIIVKRVVM